MNSDNNFKESDWIGQQKAWASAPPALRKIAAQYFLIPQMLEHNLIPSPYLPIAKLLEFTLPLQNMAATALHPTQFFSSEDPDISDRALMLRVQQLPIPDSKTINRLLASCRLAWLNRAQSMIYSHLGGSVTHLPFCGQPQAGDTEASDAEPEESDEPAVLGRGQHRKIAAKHYQGPAWEEH
ncbi:hypothetical protein B0H14DRAFT_2652514 [Mycena olivaceomarginata]|nr:hypothetical protein B0H14DRAFT_2652514 [Mycena olivaceomarginata]